MAWTQSNKRISKNDDKHSCSVAKTKVSLVCLWKSAVLRYQSRGESKNHNRIWVRVTERDLSVCVYVRCVKHGGNFHWENQKFDTDIRHLSNSQTNLHECLHFFITMHSLYLLSSLRYNQLHFKHLSFLPFSFSFSLYVRSAFSSCLLIFHVGPPIPAYQYPRHDTPQVQSIILITDQAAELCLCVCMCLCVLMDHFFLLTKP